MAGARFTIGTSQATMVSDDNPIPTTDASTMAALGATTDPESASGNGSAIALLKRLRTLLNGGLPAALGGNGGLKVESLAGEAHLGEVGGRIIRASVEFTRPADVTQYSVNDVVSDSTSATTLQPLPLGRKAGGQGYIVKLMAFSDNKSMVMPTLRVHFYTKSQATVLVAADNAPMTRKYANAAYHVGYLDVGPLTTGADTTNSTGAVGQNTSDKLPFVCDPADTNLYFCVETQTQFTPASGQKFTIACAAEVY